MERVDKVGRWRRKEWGHRSEELNLRASELWPFCEQKWENSAIQKEEGHWIATRYAQKLQRWADEARFLPGLVAALGIKVAGAIDVDKPRIEAFGAPADSTSRPSDPPARAGPAVCQQTTQGAPNSGKIIMHVMWFRKEKMRHICWHNTIKMGRSWLITPTRTSSRRYLCSRTLLSKGCTSNNNTKIRYLSQVTYCLRCRSRSSQTMRLRTAWRDRRLMTRERNKMRKRTLSLRRCSKERDIKPCSRKTGKMSILKVQEILSACD